MKRRLTAKRPQLLVLGTIAATGMILTSCGEDVPEEYLFSSTAECQQSGFDAQVCQAEYQEALNRHLVEAPRFNALDVCEAEYGEGQCTENRAQDGTSFFVPFLAGYVVSSALQRFRYGDDYFDYRRRNRYYPTPIYRNRTGQTLTTTAGSTDRTPRPYNVNTRTASRQGFGGRSSSRSFGG